MTKIGDYDLIASIGRGGMADVFLALATGMKGFQKLLVLKSLKPELAGDPEFIEMFMAEARIAALLSHPNIVQTYEVGQEGSRPFIAMEHLDGQPFSALIARVGRDKFPMDLYVHVLCEMLAGLGHAHEAVNLDGAPLGIVHRDVSPHNVFVTYDGQVKLLDFGIAKLASSSALTRHGVVKGKIGYMAPEQALGTPVDLRSDIFSCGVMLWEALARRRFVLPTDDDSVALHRRTTGNDPPAASDRPEEAALVAVAQRAMSADRPSRFASAAEMRDALEAWQTKPHNALERSLSRLVETAFEKERSQIRKLVERQVAERARASHVSLVEMVPPSADSHRALHAQADESFVTAAHRPSDAPEPTRVRSELTRRRVLMLAGGVIVGASVVGAAAKLSYHAGGPAPVSAPASNVIVSAAPEVSPPPTLVRVRVSTKPKEATLTLDGQTHTAPLDTRVPKDDKPHVLRVAAPGFLPDERPLTYESDLVVDVALEPAPPAASASTARPNTSAPRRKKVNNKPAAGLGIDEQDPYGR